MTDREPAASHQPEAGDRLVVPGAGPARPAPPSAATVGGERVNIWAGFRGVVVAVAASGLLVLALWAVSRNAPSSAVDPRLEPNPNPTVAAAPGRIDQEMYITVAAEPTAPAGATGGS